MTNKEWLLKQIEEENITPEIMHLAQEACMRFPLEECIQSWNCESCVKVWLSQERKKDD